MKQLLMKAAAFNRRATDHQRGAADRAAVFQLDQEIGGRHHLEAQFVRQFGVLLQHANLAADAGIRGKYRFVIVDVAVFDFESVVAHYFVRRLPRINLCSALANS